MANSAGSRSPWRWPREPRLLLLDEPTQGMSHADTQDTEALIRSLAARV
jgi:ABC-type uncharacterized transport system ATPase subunit